LVPRSTVRLLTVVALITHTPIGWARARHRVSIDVRGPLALIEVTRPLVFRAEYGRTASDEVVVDLDLPEGAAMAGAELHGGGRRVRLETGPAGEAQRRYDAATRAASWRAVSVPVDAGVDLRVRVSAAHLGEGERAAAWTLRYRYVAPLTCREGRLLLAMPGSLDPDPSDAGVDIRLELGSAGAGHSPPAVEVAGVALRGSGAAVLRAHTTVPQRTAWDLTIGPSGPRASGAMGAVQAAGTSTGTGESLLAVSLCRARERALSAPATRLLVLIDRSRSVGPANAVHARDLARALALALPPNLSFNAVLFDRVAEALFPLARSATLEALGALESAVGLGSLRNGTDLSLALRRAVDLTPIGGGQAKLPVYWVVITDGALPDHDTPDTLGQAVARLQADDVEVAMLILRGKGDDPVSLPARRALAEVPARLGGVIRDLPANLAVAAAGAIIDDLRGRGDLINPTVRVTALDALLPLQPIAVAAGAGAWVSSRITGPLASRVTVRGKQAGLPVSHSTRIVGIGGQWAGALLPGPTPIAWVETGTSLAALIAAPPGPAETAETTPERGRMEKDVIQRALGYAFLPRARACYLTRKITTAADFQLEGRLRLELHLERGEMTAVAVRGSNLGRPDIENCLREAAFAVEIPRAMHSDAPVIAALNLVFRPRTASKARNALVDDDAINRILGPLPPPGDPLELLIEDAVVRPAGAGR
jgi:hypothetical protein